MLRSHLVCAWLSLQVSRRNLGPNDQGQSAGRVKLMSQRHPEDRVYTVISGVFYIGLGDECNADKLAAYPPSAVIVLPGNTSHFHWAKSGEYVSQVTASGLKRRSAE